VIDLSQQEAIVPGYKTVKMLDVVFQPGSHAPQETMENDMVCHMTESGLRIVQNGGGSPIPQRGIGRAARAGCGRAVSSGLAQHRRDLRSLIAPAGGRDRCASGQRLMQAR
jgi:hypothetical protein